MKVTEQFNSIYTKFYSKAFRFTMMYVRDEPIAEDIVIDSLVKLWETMKQESVENPPALLLTILKNKSLDYLKHKIREQSTFKTIQDWHQQELNIRISTLEDCDPDYIFSKEISDIVKQTLEKLPQQTQRVFIMKRMENKSSKEIANELNISVKGVDYHIAKALKALKISLKDYLPLYIIWFLN